MEDSFVSAEIKGTIFFRLCPEFQVYGVYFALKLQRNFSQKLEERKIYEVRNFTVLSDV